MTRFLVVEDVAQATFVDGLATSLAGVEMDALVIGLGLAPMWSALGGANGV